MRKIKIHRPNTSIRIDPVVLHKARVEAVKAEKTLGEWLEAAIKEKARRKKTKKNRKKRESKST